MSFTIEKANKKDAPNLIALAGLSGSGKTYSALLMARGMAGKDGRIIVIDTESKRSCWYADNDKIGEFDIIELRDNFSSDNFLAAIKFAESQNPDAIIIDSMSHEWDGENGVLYFAEQENDRICKASKYPKSDAGLQKWIKPKMAHKRLMTYLIGCGAHIIITLRQNRTSEQCVENVNGRKQTVIKDKIATVCDKSFPFEMTVMAEIDHGTHKAKFVKLPEPLKNVFKNGDVLGLEHGKRLKLSSEEVEATSITDHPPAVQFDAIKMQIEGAETLEQLGIARDQLNQAKSTLSDEQCKELGALGIQAKNRLENQ